jgi:hypothetical protein
MEFEYMYLHLGSNYIINDSDILGIFDIETTTVSPITNKYLSLMQKSHKVVYTTYDLPRSFVVCNVKGKTTVYVTQYNTSTLIKREMKF